MLPQSELLRWLDEGEARSRITLEDGGAGHRPVTKTGEVPRLWRMGILNANWGCSCSKRATKSWRYKNE